MFDLTPKSIILAAIKSKLEPFGIQKVLLVFSCETEMYNIAVSSPEGKSMKIEISEDEITTIKKLFISRIIKAWNKDYDIEPKDIIVQIDLKDKTLLEIFVQDNNDKVHKFNY
jgi:hypothetical protein